MIAGYYAIRQKSTGFYMPSGRRRGFTRDNPVDVKVTPPRLFRRKQDAVSALQWWLEGITTVYRSFDGDEDWNTKKEDNRNADDMEIVIVELRIYQ